MEAREKEAALAAVDEIAIALVEHDYSEPDMLNSFVKAVSNGTFKSFSELNIDLSTDFYNNPKKTKTLISQVIRTIVQFGIEQSTTYYSTGELAKYFGVSITAINKMVEARRFINVKRNKPYSKLVVSEDTLWISSSGHKVSVKDVVDEWKKSNTAAESLTNQDRISLFKSEIAHFEGKYSGAYEATLKNKKDKTNEEIQDESDWIYLIERLNRYV